MIGRHAHMVLMVATLTACPPSESSRPGGYDAATASESDGSSGTSFDPPTSTTEDPSSTTNDPDDTTGGPTSSASTSTSTGEAPPMCGDGHIDNGEECDEGPNNDNEGACTDSCMLPMCGDGFLQRGEECDLGNENDNQGECTNSCTLPFCGDGFIQSGEECDEGEANDANNNGGCHPETCMVVTTCGDGILQEGEECDPSAQDDLAAACTPQCLVIRKVIFATSEFYSGNLGGLSGADAICQNHADAAELPNSDKFVAWLSTPDSAITSRLQHLPVKYVRTDGALVADGWEDLVDGTLAMPIRKDEFGDDAAEMETTAWTGTLGDGGAGSAGCSEWKSGSFKVMGLLGSIIETDAGWTNHQSVACIAQAHLYCIES